MILRLLFSFIIFASLAVYSSDSKRKVASGGNCSEVAQKAAEAISAINGYPKDVVVNIKGRPSAIERYHDKAGYFNIVTNTGNGENSCVVETLSFNPEP